MTSEARVLLLYHTAGCHLCEQAEALAAYIMSLSFAGAKKSDLEAVPQSGMGFP